jgi:DMSO/TMAO reductase YedYZ molybdopterin-dependent catalytic subunit
MKGNYYTSAVMAAAAATAAGILFLYGSNTAPDAVTGASPGALSNRAQVIYVPAAADHVLPRVEINVFESGLLAPPRAYAKMVPAGTRYADLGLFRLKISGLVNCPGEYTFRELYQRFPKYRKDILFYFAEGGKVELTWEGFLVKDLLEAAGVDTRAVAVRFYGADGYSVSFPYWDIAGRDIILAYSVNNLLFFPDEGFPLQLVSEEKFESSWVRGVVCIELISGYPGAPLESLPDASRSLIPFRDISDSSRAG